MKKNSTTHHRHSSGFTIVELMIATAVFSTILVAITVGVMYFTRQYYKSVYTSETQNVARDIADEVANAVKFGSSAVTTISSTTPGQPVLFCAGGYVFYTPSLYSGNGRYNGTPSTGFYRQPMPNGTCTAPTNTTNRKQLLAKNMRVAKINFVASASGLYTFSITVAYGDDDLLSDNGETAQCKTGAGSEYCAVSSLVTTIQKRI